MGQSELNNRCLASLDMTTPCHSERSEESAVAIGSEPAEIEPPALDMAVPKSENRFSRSVKYTGIRPRNTTSSKSRRRIKLSHSGQRPSMLGEP